MECSYGMIFFIVTFVPIILGSLWRAKKRSQLKVPPSPRGLPLIGHLHLISHLPHQALARLAVVNGPIMSLKLGSARAVVASSSEMAKHFLKTHDLVFASRFKSAAARLVAYGYQDMAYAEYGEHWRHVRKLCTLELFTRKQIQDSQKIRQEEISCTLHAILKDSHAGNLVNLNEILSNLSTNVITRMAFGKKFLGDNSNDARAKMFHELIQEEFILLGAFNWGDYIPSIAWLDIQGYERRMKAYIKDMNQFLEDMIEEHIANKSVESRHKPNDLLDVLLSKGEHLSRESIKGIIQDILSGGTDTSSITVEWALAELIRSPRTMKKLQEEIDIVVGRKRLVEEEDIVNLTYLQAVVKETFRLHPPGPLLPHQSTQDCTVAGFHIAKDTLLLVNVWAIGRDPKIWEDANAFQPERFMNDPRDVRGKDFELIPFGSGRRMCPAMPLGLCMVHIFLARFIQSFSWDPPEGLTLDDINMEEGFGLTLPRAHPLLLVPTPRMNIY